MFNKTQISWLLCGSLFLLSACQTTDEQLSPLGYSNKMVIHHYQVLDGDTISSANPEGKVIRIRLTGIDAPENDQPMGKESHKSLEQCLAGKPLIINWSTTDKYDRLLAKVIAGKQDCNLAQIQNGYAWHYKYFENDQPSIDRKNYSKVESSARIKKVGLWKSECPTPPWDWRRKRIIDCRK
ncbi:thermonuclease family protein [Acinetobacter radioresistens]|uniref:thermonuclease family protein n=1 Tax=Acinetobacter radioresistens TaxID=40216 RepID=UPI000E73C303|nr:thermonuclease family protein [Acinetobacter radioresistens]RJL70163.1 thermonuclease family protein [Acinetobacter radioresistens]